MKEVDYQKSLIKELYQLEAIIQDVDKAVGERDSTYWEVNGQRNNVLIALMLDERLAAIEELLKPLPPEIKVVEGNVQETSP